MIEKLLAINGTTVWRQAPDENGLDEEVGWLAGAQIDGDGASTSHGDPDYQGTTTYQPTLDADVIPYIVVPPQIIEQTTGAVIGSAAFLFNTATKMQCDAVVGDVGPRTKIGEISIAAAKLLGIDPDPVNGGTDERIIEYTIHVGVPAKINNIQYTLQPQL